MLITGFGPFDKFDPNPSQWLAENCGFPPASSDHPSPVTHHAYAIIPVSYAAVDDFIERTAKNPPDRLLLMGVHGSTGKFRVELVAHNHCGPTPDNLGIIAGPGPIDPSAASQLGTTLWRDQLFFAEDERWEATENAGGFLCNYIYFRSLQYLPDTEVGFLHVPPASESKDPHLSTLKVILEILSCRPLSRVRPTDMP